MSEITTRAGKGSALTHNELDANFKKAAQTKATIYTIAVTDNRDTIEYSGAGAEAFTLPDISATVAAADTGDFEVTIKHVGTGELTIARTTGTDTIDGTAADIVLSPNDSVILKSIQAGTGVNVIAGKYKGQALTSPDISGTVTGGATYTAPTITSPDIDKIVDSAGNEAVIFAEVASAVNEITVTNAASGNTPLINQTGTDDVGLTIEGIFCKNGQSSVIRSIISDAAGTNRAIDYRTAGVQRWVVATNSTAEAGASAGSDYTISRYGDAGALIDSPLQIIRSTGLCTITNLAPSSVGTAIAGQSAGGLGTEAWLVKRTVNLAISAGTNYAGTDLAYSGGTQDGLSGNIQGTGIGVALTGTWKAKGSVTAVSGRYSVTLFTKVAS